MTTNLDTLIYTTPDLRIRHLYVIGKTRMGKSTYLKNLMVSDMKEGHGICFVDPAGDDALDLLSLVPKNRIQDVIYFDPTREDSPTFNLFRLGFPPSKLTEDILAIFKMFYADSWGNQMANLMRYCIQTLLRHHAPHTLRDLQTMLRKDDWREQIVSSIADEELQEFWTHEYPSIKKSASNPILNKLSTLLAPDSLTLRIFSQPENDLDFFRIVLGKKILILNLAEGALSEEPSRLLGGMLVTALLQTVKTIPKEERQVFHLYADEFHHYVTPTFNEIMSGSAKFKLYLTMAHQNLGQLSKHPNLRSEIFGNVGSFVSFQVSSEDAAFLIKEFRGKQFIFRVPKSKDDIMLKQVLASEKKRCLDQIEFCNQKLEKIELECQRAIQDRKDWFWKLLKGEPRNNGVPLERQLDHI